MIPRLLILCLLGLAACATSAPTRTPTDVERQVRAWTSELEQLTVESRLEGGADACPRAPRVCHLARELCGVAAAEPSRQVFQERCASAQESCADFRQRCDRAGAPHARLTPTPRSP